MTRARFSGAAQALHGGERGHDEEAAADRDGDEFEQRHEALVGGEELPARRRRRLDEIPVKVQASARLATPMTTPPSGTTAIFGRWWLQRAASSEPIATPIAKTSMNSVLTFSVPPIVCVTIGREQRKRHRAGEPEPGDDQRAVPDARVGSRLGDQMTASRSRDSW